MRMDKLVKTAKVALAAATFAIDRPYTYRVPDALAEKLVPGMRVLVPFGAGNRPSEGLVLSLADEVPEGRLKEIGTLLDPRPVLTQEGIRLALWMRERFFCTVYAAALTMLPTGLWYVLRESYAIAPGVDRETWEEKTARSPKAKQIMGLLYAAGGQADLDQIKAIPDLKDPRATLRELEKAGLITRQTQAKRKVGDKTEPIARLTMDPAEAMALLAPKQKTSPMGYRVTELLCRLGSASVKELCYFTGASRATIKSLAKKGVLALEEKEVFRRAMPETGESTPLSTLNDQQQAAYQGLLDLMEEPAPQAALLYGVTGSGKTQVYMRLIDRALQQGKDTIVLVPEIGLTPQVLGLFHQRYGRQVAVLHSGLSIGERNDEYRRADRGEAKIVLGTRSAVFAPLHALGLIIMDEEQELTYKSERTPRYHARDIARYRAGESGALFVMASATPSIESYAAAKAGKYTLCSLEHRFGNAALPQVCTVDMKGELHAGHRSPLSRTLQKQIQSNLDAGKQTILLMNRRGYNTFIACNDCGHVITCPNCSISLTYHSYSNRLMCHYCGYSKPLDNTCPECGSHAVRYSGFGTQRIEDELQALFPAARILRMDADTTAGKFSHQKLFDAFASHEYDILVGTQMVAKGLDFDDVTLVGVVNADNALYDENYLSHERAFDLITQVVGRSGRRDATGMAVIQTIDPCNPVIDLAARQDYPAFFETEYALRRILTYPPFCDIYGVFFISEDENAAALAAKAFFDTLVLENKEQQQKLIVLGPSPARISKISNTYRYRLAIKCKNSKSVRNLLMQVLKATVKMKELRKVQISIDLNPIDLG